VRVENDVNIAALGELADGVAKGSATFAMLSIGTGIGAGIVVDGHILSGAHGGAGEVAYLPTGADPATTSARRRGAFEVAASGSGVRAILADELHARPASDLGGTALRPSSDARAVFEAAVSGDEVALAVVDRHAALIAEALLSIVATIDPELIVLAGGIGSNPVLLQPVRQALERIAPFPVRVETTLLGSRAGVVGAVVDAQRRAFQSLFERHPFGAARFDRVGAGGRTVSISSDGEADE
jgi:predicted NBD/HSP70 family sugar kinase